MHCANWYLVLSLTWGRQLALTQQGECWPVCGTNILFLPSCPVDDSEGPGSETRLDRPVAAKGTRRRHPPPPFSFTTVTTEGGNRTTGELSEGIETSLKVTKKPD